MKKLTKIATLAVLALTTTAFAAEYALLSGKLSADHYRNHEYKIGRGYWKVDVVNLNPGDLDVKIINADGEVVASDTLSDNHPMVNFYNPTTQEMTVRVINSSSSYSADYVGTIR